jgi:hypothetical protein
MIIRARLCTFSLALLTAATVQQAAATVVLPQNIEQLESQAQLIFVGVCTTRTAAIDERGIPVNVFTFRVAEPVKGDLKKDGHVTFRQLGDGVPNTHGMTMYIIGIPIHVIGQKVVLFLNAPSRIGLTSPVGLWQGIFPVDRDAQGNEGISLDRLRRKDLVAGVAKEKYAATRRLTVGEETLLSDPPERVDVATFCSLVRKISQEREQRGKGQ